MLQQIQEEENIYLPPKRKRGRPKGSSKPIVPKRKIGRPGKDSESSLIKTTLIFHLNKSCEAQVIINRGGARSSKSYSIMQLLIEYFFTIPKIKILILRKVQPSLRTSVRPLLYEILDSYNLTNRITEVKADNNIWSPVKGLIHFGGLDDPEKIKCFHPDTEILTPDGFKFVEKIKKGDLVASVNPKTFEAQYLPVKEANVYHYAGDMISPASETGVRDPHTNFCVTPEHKMLVYSITSLKYKHREGRQFRWRFKEAGKLPAYDGGYSVPVSCKWNSGDLPEYFEIPRVNWNAVQGGKRNKNGKKPTVFPIISWLKFLGWYLSEGNCDCTTVMISQMKPEGITKIKEDLKDFPIKVVPITDKFSVPNGFVLYSKDLVDYLKQFGDCYHKFIPREILNYHPSLLKHLLDSLIAGDGRKESKNRFSYGSSSKQLAEDVCEIAIKLGYSTSIREVDTSTYYPEGKPCWGVSMVLRERSSIIKTKRVPYSGMVYCPTVPPFHTVITRYKGKVVITGQSSDWNVVWIEESNEFTYDDFINLKLRLSAPLYQDFRNKIILSFNPVDEFCYIKTKIIDNKSEDFKEIVSTYKLNPFLSQDYVKTIEALEFQDANYYRIFAQGQWGRLENIIFSNWETVSVLPAGEMIFGLDFGYTNPSSLVKLTVDGLEAGVECMLYQPGLTNADLIVQLNRIITLEQKSKCPVYCDAAEPARIQEIKDAGFWALPADKSVKDGIDYVKRHHLQIKDDSDQILKELKGYSYKTDKSGRVLEEPVKWNDHCLDSIRYGLYTHYVHTTKDIPGIKVLNWKDDTARDEWGDDD